MSEMKDRIRLIMESQHMSQKVFANFIGMSEGSLSGLYSGRTRPTLNIVELIKDKIPAISTDWLMFGKGPMYMDESVAENLQVQQPEQSAIAVKPSSPHPIGDLFDVVSTPNAAPTTRMEPRKEIKIPEKPPRKITEIKVFYDDQTFESFVPKK